MNESTAEEKRRAEVGTLYDEKDSDRVTMLKAWVADLQRDEGVLLAQCAKLEKEANHQRLRAEGLSRALRRANELLAKRTA